MGNEGFEDVGWVDDKDTMIDVFKRVYEDDDKHDEEKVIDFVRKRRFKPQRERSEVRRKHTITQKVELQSVVFVTRQDMFLKLPRKKRGKRVPKTRVPARTFSRKEFKVMCSISGSHH